MFVVGLFCCYLLVTAGTKYSLIFNPQLFNLRDNDLRVEARPISLKFTVIQIFYPVGIYNRSLQDDAVVVALFNDTSANLTLYGDYSEFFVQCT